MTHPKKSSRGGTPVTTLRRVNWSTDIDTVRRLFREYRDWVAEHRDPSADDRVRAGLGLIDELISGLPGAYGPPRGDVILAFSGGDLVACGALRELEPHVGEIKRVYVRADHRGPVFGPRLTRALLDRARDLKYARVRVDTLPTMAAANEFYPAMGFEPIPSYWPHPVAGAHFYEFRLESPRSTLRRPGHRASK